MPNRAGYVVVFFASALGGVQVGQRPYFGVFKMRVLLFRSRFVTSLLPALMIVFFIGTANADVCSPALAGLYVDAQPPEIKKSPIISRIVTAITPDLQVSTDGEDWSSILSQVFELPVGKRYSALLSLSAQLQSVPHHIALSFSNMLPESQRARARTLFEDILGTDLRSYPLLDQLRILAQWPELAAEPLLISDAKVLGRLVVDAPDLLASLLEADMLRLDKEAVQPSEWPSKKIDSSLALLILLNFPAQDLLSVSAELQTCEIENPRLVYRASDLSSPVFLTRWDSDKLIAFMQRNRWINPDLVRLVRSSRANSWGLKAFAAVVRNSYFRTLGLAELALKVQTFDGLVAFVKAIQNHDFTSYSLAELAAKKVRNPHAREAFIFILESVGFRSYGLAELTTNIQNSYQLDALRLVANSGVGTYDLAALVISRVKTEESLQRLHEYFSRANSISYPTLRAILS